MRARGSLLQKTQMPALDGRTLGSRRIRLVVGFGFLGGLVRAGVAGVHVGRVVVTSAAARRSEEREGEK